MMAPLPSKELETYEANLVSLLGTHEGKYVPIHGDSILGVLDSQMDAITPGYRQLGNVPFLVRQVLKIVPISTLSSDNVPCFRYVVRLVP
jgi:hypothetical protein